ncbi:MAG TPA: NifU family protein [Acidimicrobiales bacterium]|nr:NifU family protein [Acidimicrobiales bacterium]
MNKLSEVLDRLELRLAELEELAEPTRTSVFELLDGIDALHRLALHRLAALADAGELSRIRAEDPAVEWLFSAYGVGVDEREATEAALAAVRPYIHSHGGSLELVDVADGRVRLRMAGSCSGCTASAVTLRHGIEEALREHLPAFVSVEVEEDHDAAPHPPPGETLVELGRKSA